MTVSRAINGFTALTVSLALLILLHSPHILRNALFDPQIEQTPDAAQLDAAARPRPLRPPGTTVIERFNAARLRAEWDQLRRRIPPRARLTSLSLDVGGVVHVSTIERVRARGRADVRVVDLFSDDAAHIVSYLSGPRGAIDTISGNLRPTFTVTEVNLAPPASILKQAANDASDLTALRLQRSSGGVLAWAASWTPFDGNAVYRYFDTDGGPITLKQALIAR